MPTDPESETKAFLLFWPLARSLTLQPLASSSCLQILAIFANFGDFGNL